MPFKDKQAKTNYQRAYMRRCRAALLDPVNVRPIALDPVEPIAIVVREPEQRSGPLTKQQQVKGFNRKPEKATPKNRVV